MNGLKGILETNSLWVSAAYFLNDSSEIECGCSLLLKELPSWLELNKGSTRVAAHVLTALQQIFGHPSSRMSRSLNIFVVCFCEKDNLLSQWRAYGQKGGYALGFQGSIKTNMNTAGPFSLSLTKVIYNEALQIQRIRDVLREALQTIDEELGETVIMDALSRDIVLMVQELLLDEIVRFKHPAFIDEREWRLVVRYDFRRDFLSSQPTQAKTQKGASADHLFKFRSTGGSIVPFVELKPTKGKLPLRTIRFGPSLDFKRHEDSMRLFLAAHGFSSVDISGSGLPVVL